MRPSSLRWRLLAATVAALAVALLLAGWGLTALFKAHVTQQFEASLRVHLDDLTARTEFNGPASPASPRVDTAALSDPRWQKPYSGLYWQLDGTGRPAWQRSRSLWDTNLVVPSDTLADGQVHAHPGRGPQGSPLLMLERTIHPSGQAEARWRLVVAGSTETIDQAVAHFRGQLALSLLLLATLLTLAAWAQVSIGLAPLRAMRRGLEAVRQGQAPRLQGRFPAEVQPLVDDFNAVLDQNASMVSRARQHAGNLAHAVKTPLTVLRQAADQLARAPAQTQATPGQDPRALAQLMGEHIDLASRHVDWHLARARSAAHARNPGQATPVGPVVQGLIRVMQRVHADARLHLQAELPDAALAFQGEEQDLQEMLGNLLDNACKWARSRVTVHARRIPQSQEGLRPWLEIRIEDDGTGIDAQALTAVKGRGVRLDESVPGTGLGLAIVQDLVELYGGQLGLQASASGGLQATLTLPAA